MTRRGTTWWLAGWAVLIGLSLLVAAGATKWVDQATLGWFTALDRPHAVHVAWRTLVMGGQFWLVGTATVVLGVVRAWQWRSWRPALVSTAAVASNDVLLWVSKHLVGRTSPHSGLNEVLVGGTSYPSGHTANAALCLVLLAVLAAGPHRRPIALATVFAFVVGIANLVLGYHWAAEVLAGWLLGGLIAVAAIQQLSAPQNSGVVTPAPARREWLRR